MSALVPAHRLQVLHVIDALAGCDHHLAAVELCKATSALIGRVGLIVIAPPIERYLWQALEQAQIEILGPIADSPGELAVPLRLNIALKAWDPHIVHAHGPIAGAAVATSLTIGFGFQMPYVYTNYGIHRAEPAFVRVCRFLALRRANAFVSSSQVEATLILSRYRRLAARHHLVYCGVPCDLLPATKRRDIRRALQVGDRDILIAVGGVLHSDVRLDLAANALKEALRRTADENCRICLVFTADGEAVRLAEEIVKAEGIAVQKNPAGATFYELLAAADVYVNFTQRETLPYPLLYAMGQKTVPVWTDVGAVTEVIQHGLNGFVAQPSDVRMFAYLLSELIASPIARERMGKAARKTICERFAVHTAARNYVGLYMELLRRMM